ncbi:lytic polysaccharide monooxygenase [Vibrio sp. S4M6]|uniref:lytic polysaccharide monooxygenase n=1 Tax=Vibrio sinus TaxID=2946865 RepID=UPI00202A21C6|nr:lytic polysaccharide monooxygenase [Vibrio sinus]MCL9780712.1 lytic polysaccharide monooxygenase [Vibrio sinus]
MKLRRFPKVTLSSSQMVRQFWLILSLFTSISVSAHGWTEYPIARQTLCYDQGGIWNGTPPDPACAQALLTSGAYPFVQRNEFAINIADFDNHEAVMRAIPDGTLCYANDAQKSGIASTIVPWQKTNIPVGRSQLIFNATAPHNPSFWRIYLTKPSANLTQPLAWDDLELINEYGDIPVTENRKYLMDITIPKDRKGAAVLYVRWQRNDPAGEGFYNCSDINIINRAGIELMPYLSQGSAFIPEEITLHSVDVGDIVEYTVFRQQGQPHSYFELLITEKNIKDWDRLIAADITGYYQKNHDGDVAIGYWNEPMQHYMYFQGDPTRNSFQSRDSSWYGRLTIRNATKLKDNFNVRISPKLLTKLEGAQVAQVAHGEHLYLFTNADGVEPSLVSWSQISGPTVKTTLGSNHLLIIETASITAPLPVELSFVLSATYQGVSKKAIYSFRVVGNPLRAIRP